MWWRTHTEALANRITLSPPSLCTKCASRPRRLLAAAILNFYNGQDVLMNCPDGPPSYFPIEQHPVRDLTGFDYVHPCINAVISMSTTGMKSEGAAAR